MLVRFPECRQEAGRVRRFQRGVQADICDSGWSGQTMSFEPSRLSASPARFPRESLVWPLPDDDIALILQAMLSDGAWGRYEGEYGARCCAALRDSFGLPHVLLCSSGTIAVEIALRGLGVRPGDEVAVAAYDFPGNFRAIEAVGARPVVVDIEPSSWSLDPQQLEEALGPATRAAIFSHLHGRLAAAATLCRADCSDGYAPIKRMLNGSSPIFPQAMTFPSRLSRLSSTIVIDC